MYNFLKNTLGLKNKNLIAEIMEVSTIRHLKKGEYLIKTGDPLEYMPFLFSEGILRNFMTDAEGREFTDCFAIKKGDPLLSCGKLTDPTAMLSLQALTDLEVLNIPIKDVLSFQKRYPEVLALEARLVFESANLHWKLKRVHFQYSAMERYEWFLENYPGLIDIVNNKYIASFLDMTPVTLSRLRAKIREGGG